MSIATAIVAKAPTVYWKLDDPNGPAASDSSGNGHPGIYAGAFNTAQSGPELNTSSVFFFANNGNVWINPNPFGNIFPWSLSVWMAVSQFPPAGQAFMYWADFSTKGFGYTATSNGLVNALLGVNRYNVSQLVSTAQITDGDWHNYVMVQGRTNPAVLWELYRDGVLILSSGTGYNANAVGSGLFGIGGISGFFAHFALFSSALTAADVATMYAARINPVAAPSAGGGGVTPDDLLLRQILKSVQKTY